MATMPHMKTSQSSYVAGKDIIADLNKTEFPNLFAFVCDADRLGSEASKCKTSIDALEISPCSCSSKVNCAGNDDTKLQMRLPARRQPF
jgi:hypothetical protein